MRLTPRLLWNDEHDQTLIVRFDHLRDLIAAFELLIEGQIVLIKTYLTLQSLVFASRERDQCVIEELMIRKRIPMNETDTLKNYLLR